MDSFTCVARSGRQGMSCAILAVGLSMAVSSAASARVTWITRDTGTLLTVGAVNGQGDVAGVWANAKGNRAVYLRTADGKVADLSIPNASAVTGIDENDDLIGTYQPPTANAWFVVQRPGGGGGELWTVHINPKGESVRGVDLSSMNTSVGEVVGSYSDTKGRFHSFTVSYPTQTQNPQITFFDCQFDDGTQANSTIAVSGDSGGDIAGSWFDKTASHGFFRRGSGNCISFDPPGYTSTTAMDLDDWDDMVGTSRASDGTLSAFVLYGDTLIDGSKKPSFADLGTDVFPSYLVTRMNRKTGGTSDYILGLAADGQPTSFTVARNANETFGKVKSSQILLDRCAAQSVVFAGIASFADEIAGYCKDSSSQQVIGFLAPMN